MRGFKLEFIDTPTQSQPCRELPLKHVEKAALKKELQNLLTKKVIGLVVQ